MKPSSVLEPRDPGFVIQHPDPQATQKFKYVKAYRLNEYLHFPGNPRIRFWSGVCYCQLTERLKINTRTSKMEYSNLSPLVRTKKGHPYFHDEIENRTHMCYSNPLRSNGLVVRALDLSFPIQAFRVQNYCVTRSRLSLSSFRGRPNQYQEHLGTQW